MSVYAAVPMRVVVLATMLSAVLLVAVQYPGRVEQGYASESCETEHVETACFHAVSPVATTSPVQKPRVGLSRGAVATASAKCSDRGGLQISAVVEWSSSKSCYSSYLPTASPQPSTGSVRIERPGIPGSQAIGLCLRDPEEYEIFVEYDCVECDPTELVYGSVVFRMKCCDDCP